MILVDRMRRLNWRLVGLATSAIVVLNIVATLISPEIASAPAISRLTRALPANKMQIVPPVTAEQQPLPFMAPDAQYAMCRYDSSQGTVSISAILPDAGWTLALYSNDGDNFYTAVAQPGRATHVALELIATDERFAGLTPEAQGKVATEQNYLTLVAKRGIAVLRAPDMGYSFRAQVQADLAKAACSVKSKS